MSEIMGKFRFDIDFELASDLNPLISNTISHLIIRPASQHQDLHQATDLYVPDDRKAIGARVRRPGILKPVGLTDKWHWEIRSERPSGLPTELHKVMAGHSDVSFYGHLNHDSTQFVEWWLLNLNVFRRVYTTNPHLGHDWRYRDGTHVRRFDVRDFPHELVIGGSNRHPSKPYSEVEMQVITLNAQRAAMRQQNKIKR